MSLEKQSEEVQVIGLIQGGDNKDGVKYIQFYHFDPDMITGRENDSGWWTYAEIPYDVFVGKTDEIPEGCELDPDVLKVIRNGRIKVTLLIDCLNESYDMDIAREITDVMGKVSEAGGSVASYGLASVRGMGEQVWDVSGEKYCLEEAWQGLSDSDEVFDTIEDMLRHFVERTRWFPTDSREYSSVWLDECPEDEEDPYYEQCIGVYDEDWVNPIEGMFVTADFVLHSNPDFDRCVAVVRGIMVDAFSRNPVWGQGDPGLEEDN